jgi:carbon storage regulator
MLILSRKINESIIIDGRIVVKVLRIEKDTVKIGIQAPAELPVHREEIHEAILKSKQNSGAHASPGVTKAGQGVNQGAADPPGATRTPIE